MPLVPLNELPDDARTWVFGSDKSLDESAGTALLIETDKFLAGWKAHGSQLTSGRDWSHRRFLTVAVDQSAAGASGCSIDGLFRALRSLEPKLGASLVNSGLIYYRDDSGDVQSVTRDTFTSLAANGKIRQETKVFDPTVITLGEWRSKFESDVDHSWHSGLIPGSARESV